MVKLRLRIDSTAARGIIQMQGCRPLKHLEIRLLWLQAKHEERKLTVIKEPTQTNTRPSQVSIYVKPCEGLSPPKHVWRLRPAMNGTRPASKAVGNWVRQSACEHGLDEIKIAPTLLRSEVRSAR